MSEVIYVNARGMARLDGEQERVSQLLSRATPPERCGPEIPVAPARGPMVAFVPREMVVTDAGNIVSRRSGYLGRDAARVADAFDRMTLAAQKAHARRVQEARRCKRPEPEFVAPFTHGQVSAARDYAALAERCASSGVKCSSLEALRQASSGGGDREAAVLRDFQRLRALQARIGDGLAREVRRVRPSNSGRPRSAIRVRALVDMVCLGGLTLDEVLRRHGWTAANGKMRDALRRALCAALDRMQGYDLTRPQNVG